MDRNEALRVVVKAAGEWAGRLEENARQGQPAGGVEARGEEIREAVSLLSAPSSGRMVELGEGVVCLRVDDGRCDVLDRALKGYAKVLQDARDLGIITHETFCSKADKARAMHYMVWACQEEIKAKTEQPEAL